MSTHHPGPDYITPATASPKWAQLRDALLDLTRLGELEPAAAMTRLLTVSCQALDVARVSFWKLEANHQALERQLMYQILQGLDEKPSRLTATQAPSYFAALERTLTLAAEDVLLDTRTQELLETYLRPLGIGAMLDVAVRDSGRLVGVICHEHVGGPRAWSAEERMFVAAISVLAGQQIEHQRRMRAEDERRLALLTDRLTGLPNRIRFVEALAEKLAEPESEVGILLVADLDRFHRINHAFGAEIGDRVLCEAARRLAGRYPVERLARLGNDQFAVLTPPVPGADRECAALAEIEGLRTALQEPVDIDGRRIDLTVSLGVLLDASDYRSADLALRDAMIAADTASRGPRSNLALFDARIRGRVEKRLRLELELRRAVGCNEFELHLQPIFRLSDKALVGAEALLRWRHPERGLLLPAEFLEVAEEAGLLAGIHAQVLDASLERVARWRERTGRADFRLSLNLSASQLGDERIAQRLMAAAQRWRLGPSALHLEVTENTLLDASTGVMPTLSSLAALGAELSLDDFGTGYASITHLARLPLASVKIDQGFVAKLDADPKVADIVRGLVQMGHALGLRVIAEGVESPAQLEALQEMECDEAQGFLLGRPVPLDLFETHWIDLEAAAAGAGKA